MEAVSRNSVIPTIMDALGGDTMLCDFVRDGSFLIGKITHAFDCVACAQHLGISTRLVD